MEHENIIINIEGEEVRDVYPDIISLEVELDDELASMFRLKLAILQQPEGRWSYLDDTRLRAWKKMTISAGFAGGAEEVMSGYITHVKPDFTADPAQCTLEIWGMDSSVLMDREEKLKDWVNKKDSDIASEIFSLYGFTPAVEDTRIVHDEAVSTIIQRETDMQFLKRLALRNGLECYVEGATGYFRPPQVNGPPQPVLAVHFGKETNVNRFAIEVNALTPTNVAMVQIDRISKEILDAAAESGRQLALGSTDADDLLGTGISPGQVYVGMNTATGNLEMSALCQGLFDQAEWFLTGEGEIAANHYGHVLKPRGTVTVKGIGASYSGVYYVNHVTHRFTADGYIQRFRVKRNALNPTGAENFSGTASGLLGGLF
jgi:phage protein D